MIPKYKQYSKEQLEELLNNCSSFNEFVLKLGYARKTGKLYRIIKDYLKESGIVIPDYQTHFNERKSDDEIFCKNSTVDQSTVRKRYKSLTHIEYKCAICGLPAFWNGKPLVLTLDHIDGDNCNNELSNLRWVCPNCDRQLPTFGARNIKTYT